ncbi:hypothetical protein FE257_007263 [Aspergillus nanangensis]|uniref:NmrA-like domain-containing protein n=1 Tax=Aspergillus nanangensis TaxID=2582783 RepID=A0AAD4CNM2_ASPNN|nr:hypothetical protein FE257_007263 [Aspergillus nanangensis]
MEKQEKQEKQTIALAGVGDFGRYIYEVLDADDRYNVVILSRQSKPLYPPSAVHITPSYSEESVYSILQSTRATTLISTIQCPDSAFVTIHQNLLNACLRSTHCKRFIPSEYGGDIERFPHLPGGYARSRLPFRDILAQSHGVEWTLLNLGWFMDYFLPQAMSYIHHVPGEFPVQWESWRYTVRGTGEEPQNTALWVDMIARVYEDLVHCAHQVNSLNANHWDSEITQQLSESETDSSF